ncbi:MAG TPA: DUF87 domain-containing protein [Allosphingosinicella sp.]|nr:DUF87 domain-containing protein [Allosphingosinicella sp.]
MIDVADAAERWPAAPIIVEIAIAAERLLELEDVEPFELDWARVEADAAVAVGARQMLARRRRWATQYDKCLSLFRRQLIQGFSGVVEALPESCFERWDEEVEPLFSVSLASLLEDPAKIIESLILATYTDETLRLELFHRLRSQLVLNFLVASGFPPTTDPNDVNDRLVLPTHQRGKNGAELAEMYLAGTPFLDLFELPVPFHVPEELRFEHCHIIGGTGHGKTQLMQRMIHADLVAAKDDGRSVIVIDSQGDLINKLVRLDLFSPGAEHDLPDRLVVIDPSDVEHPAALNLFDAHLERVRGYGPADRERVLNGVVELYETFFGALLGAELTQKQGVIFRYLARLMLTIPGANVHTLMELMDDGKPFKPYMAALEGSARFFFEKEFFHPSFAATKKQILKRLWGVLSTPAFERMFAQKENKLDLFEATKGGKIILISTAKDLLKTEGSQLFGRFFIAMFAQATLERSTLPESERTPTFVYVDEAQEYFDDTIETILSQARKYRVGITLAHQTLDQLSPRLRAAFLANTSLKCAGGVSAKDARALAPELRTTPEFIEGMCRRADRTQFAVWLKHRTREALELSVPLGFLERQPTLPEEELDSLIARNRERYSGTPDLRAWRSFAAEPDMSRSESFGQAPERESIEPPSPAAVQPTRPHERGSGEPRHVRANRMPAPAPRELGKGGPKHRYLQSLVKELAEQQGFRATIEAPLSGGGQVDVLIERDEVRAAVEVSVTTPAEYERQSVRRCLDAGIAHVAVLVAKSRGSQERLRSAVTQSLSAEELARVSFLFPEDLPDYIASLAPPPDPEVATVAGYKVRVSRTAVAPEEARERRERLAKIVSRSIGQHKD